MATQSDKNHKFLQYPLGRFCNPKDDNGKCWHAINMIYCGLPRDAEIHRTTQSTTGERDEAMAHLLIYEYASDTGQLREEIVRAFSEIRAEAWKEAIEVVGAQPDGYGYAKRDTITALEAAANGGVK